MTFFSYNRTSLKLTVLSVILTAASSFQLRAQTQIKDGVIESGNRTGQWEVYNVLTIKQGVTLKTGFHAYAIPNNLELETTAPYSNDDASFNYVRHAVYRTEGQNTNDPNAKPKEDVEITNSYYDGLGRTYQVIAKQASAAGLDVVQVAGHDSHGRSARSFMGYESSHATGNKKTNALHANDNQGDVFDFYNGYSGISDDSRPFSETTFDNSPLNRVKATKGPGQDWHTAGRSSAIDYLLNDATEVIKWGISGGLPTNNGYYDANTLTKLVSTDEEGHQTIQFSNSQGQSILTKVQVNEAATEWAISYNVYDDFGNLRFVLPPMIFHGNNTIDAGELDAYAFQYQYDDKQRMIAKRTPGKKGWTYFVFDPWGRLILSQSPNDALNDKWTYTKYDEKNRPAVTGLCTITGKSVDDIREDVFDAMFDRYEVSEENEVWVYSLDRTYPRSGALEAYIATSDILVVTFYDNYDFMTQFWGDDFDQPNNTLTHKGFETGGLLRVLGGGLLKSAIYYDDRFRVVKTISENHLGGVDVNTTTYENKLLSRATTSSWTHSDGTNIKTVSESYAYDHRDRLKSVTTSIDGNESTISYEYNKFSDTESVSLDGVQHVDYDYNIRGWLTNINGGTTFDNSNDVFGMSLKYHNNSTGASYYNGNISRMDWKLDAPNLDPFNAQTYQYTYDPMNRLKTATYEETGKDGFYNVSGNESGIAYDLNGNIKNLSRQQEVNGASHEIDDLTYAYDDDNQLISVQDNGETGTFDDNGTLVVHESLGFKDGHDSTEELPDYEYDDNGNLTVDRNKGVTITYNFLNLPVRVEKSDGSGDYIQYTYDAAGNKLSTETQSGSNHITSDYVGGAQYFDDVLATIYVRNGRYIAADQSYLYIITDHLGNVRALVNESGEVEHYKHYYPYGMTMANKATDALGYQRKEYQDIAEVYNFHARQYDASLGRFISVDPADQYVSGYVGMGNNPTGMIDPDGRWSFIKRIFGAEKTNKTIDTYQQIAINHIVLSNSIMLSMFTGGAAGAWMSGVVGGTSSFWGAVAVNSTSGAVSGFVSNGGMALGHGGDFNDVIRAGGRGALIGGISAAIEASAFKGLARIGHPTTINQHGKIPTDSYSWGGSSWRKIVSSTLAGGARSVAGEWNFRKVGDGLTLGTIKGAVDVAVATMIQYDSRPRRIRYSDGSGTIKTGGAGTAFGGRSLWHDEYTSLLFTPGGFGSVRDHYLHDRLTSAVFRIMRVEVPEDHEEREALYWPYINPRLER